VSDALWATASTVIVLASVVETAASIAVFASPVGSGISGVSVEASGEVASSLSEDLVGVDFDPHSDRFRASEGFRLKSSVLVEFVGCHSSVQNMADNQQRSHPQRGK